MCGGRRRYAFHVRSLNDLAAEILSDKTHVSWEGVRHACRLMLAYADYNCAAADSKHGPAIGRDGENVIDTTMGALAELEHLHDECERAWRDFKGAEWPRGDVDVWLTNDKRFCEALERSTHALATLRAAHFGATAET